MKTDHNDHRKRLRRKFLQGGIKAFHDYEMVEYFLTFSITVKDVKPLAKQLISMFKTISGIMDADPIQLKQIKGIGEATVSSVSFFKALFQHYLKEQMENAPIISSSEEALSFFAASFRGKKRELFKVLFLNNANRLIAEQTIHEGTVDQTAVYPREIMAEALRLGATRLICAHNHPSGGVEPSPADKVITRQLIAAAYLLGIDVLEHVIVGGLAHFSFAANGLINEYYQALRERKADD